MGGGEVGAGAGPGDGAAAVMPNITRGARMSGLLVYLAGPGKANEHREPHLVAGDPAIMAWHDDAELDRDAALDVAKQLDAPRRAFGTEITVPVKRATEDGRTEIVGARDAHVWHCSLSLRAEEGQLTDAKWAAVARDFVDGMGFTETSGKAPCRWVALRHGVSKAGNDHVHIAVSLVREDGTRASVWKDRERAQRLAGELERRHGLQVLESREAGRGARGEKPAERETAARRAAGAERAEATAGSRAAGDAGAGEVARARLARVVRGAAAAAGDEAEFVRRCRRAGVQLRPRYAAGRDDVVAGYSAALRPDAGQKTIWYGGGHLARDLTLPRLRADWPDTPHTAAAAVQEWRAARRNQRPVAPGREVREPDPGLWTRYTAEVADLRERLRAVPPGDRDTWAHVARETAGAFAAWSVRVEPTPGPLAATAEALARSAQVRARQVRPRRADLPSARGAALLFASAARGGHGEFAQAVLLRQLANTARALHDAHLAVGEARRAAEIAAAVRGQLQLVAERLPSPGPAAAAAGQADAGPGRAAGGEPVPEDAAAAVRVAHAGLANDGRPVGSPLPNRLPGSAAAPARRGAPGTVPGRDREEAER